MSKRYVIIQEVHSVVIEVEDATSDDDARNQAAEYVETGLYPNGKKIPEVVYDHMVETYEWDVFI